MPENSRTVRITTEPSDKDARLDIFLARRMPEYSRGFFQGLIKDGKVKVNGFPCKLPRFVFKEKPSDIELDLPPPPERKKLPEPEEIALTIIYEDDDLMVLNKPAGIVVHPGAGNESGTLLNALLAKDREFSGKFSNPERPGLVHRIDKDTSGCLVVAKNEAALLKLARDFSERNVKKTYAALVYGIPKRPEGEIRTLMGRHPKNRLKMAVVTDGEGREAVSKYKILKAGRLFDSDASLLEVRIFTGRTHQIRLHMSHIRHPIIGDELYGGRQKVRAKRQMLHAWKLSFGHPATGVEMSFEAPFPKDFNALVEKLVPN